jgi:hypothetical protein
MTVRSTLRQTLPLGTRVVTRPNTIEVTIIQAVRVTHLLRDNSYGGPCRRCVLVL